MSIYEYKAVDLSGKIFSAKLEFNSEEEVIDYLKSNQLIPISITQVKWFNTDLKEIKLFKPKITNKDLAMFCRQFALIIDSGIPEIIAFDVIIQQIENVALQKIMDNVYQSIQQGNSISEAMKVHKEFPEFMISIIEAGEITGKLSISFKRLAQQYDKNLANSRKIKSAMSYPLIVMSIMLIAIILITTFVIPNYINMFEQMDAQLPKITLFLIKINNFIIYNWYIIIILFIILFALKLFLKSYKLKLIKDKILIKLPLLGKLIIKINTMIFSQNMAILLSSGVSILDSLKIVKKLIDNSIIKESMTVIIYEVEKGISLSEAIGNSKIFLQTLKNVIKIGEEAGFEAEINMLEKISKLYNDDIDIRIDTLTKLIEPALTIILAVIIGFVMLAVIMPSFSLATQIS